MSYFDDASLVMIPSGYKTSKVYSVKPTDGTGDLTFSRSNDTATRVNSAGLIEKVRTNRLLQSNTFNTTWTLTDASVTIGQSGYDGTSNAWLLNVTAGTGSQRVEQSVVSSTLSTYSVYLKAGTTDWVALRATGSPVNCLVWFDLSTGTKGANQNATNYTITSVGSGWYRCTLTTTTTIDKVYIYPATANDIAGLNCTSGDNILIQAAQLETGDIATDYIATTSAAVSVGPVANVPRLDYLNSSCPRLLLEPQRTNLITYSEQLNNAAWVTGQSGTGVAPVVTANNAISPDGTQNADTVVFNSGAGTTASDFSTLFQTFGGTTATYTGSFYAKTASGTAQIQVRIDGNNYDKFTITNQWQRFTLTKALTGTGNIFEMVIRRGLNEPMNASATIQLWGVQVELGAYATSYIPTLGAAVTRGADACSKTSISSLIGSTAGTVYFEGVYDSGNTADVRFVTLKGAGGTYANLFIVQDKNNGTFNLSILDNSLSVQADITWTHGLTNGQSFKIAIAYASNDVVVYQNGSSKGTDTSYTPVTFSDFYLQYTDVLGKTQTSQALLFKTRLTNAQLAELTTI